MKMVKSLLLGSAAGLVAVAGAQAADLPVKAKPVQYVKICSLYGVGFYYIPGTDMCLKVGGWVRAEYAYGDNGNMTWGPFNGNNNDRGTNNSTWRARGYITADARNQTSCGAEEKTFHHLHLNLQVRLWEGSVSAGCMHTPWKVPFSPRLICPAAVPLYCPATEHGDLGMPPSVAMPP